MIRLLQDTSIWKIVRSFVVHKGAPCFLNDTLYSALRETNDEMGDMMGQAKKQMMTENFEKEQAHQRKLDGYRKHLIVTGEYSGQDCPYCDTPLKEVDLAANKCPTCENELIHD